MLFGHNPPEITYLGLPNEVVSKGKIEINSYIDLITIFVDTCKFNLPLDIKTVCIDTSELTFTPNFFKTKIEEESPEASSLIYEANQMIAKNGIRICVFIGKDYFLGSQLEDVKNSSVSLLDSISGVLDALGINYPSIMVRIGSAYGNRKNTMSEFCKRLKLLDPSTVSKLCVVNDDKPSLFSITDLLTGVYYKSGIPISFRLLPHQFNDGGLSIREALFLSCSSWTNGKKPIFFYSESKEYDPNGIPLTSQPSDYLTRRIPTFGLYADVVIESPCKEDVCLKYRMDYKSLPPIVINRIGQK
jgi:UV DNA damage repair endonuclease